MASCPACGREAKAAHGGRLSAGEATRLGRNGRWWRCYACGEHGGSAELVSWAWYGRALRDLDRGRVREMSERVDRECGTEAVVPVYVPPPDPREVQQARARQPITYRGQTIDWDQMIERWCYRELDAHTDERVRVLASPGPMVLRLQYEMRSARAAREQNSLGGDDHEP